MRIRIRVPERLQEQLQPRFQWLDAHTGGAVGIITGAYRNFILMNGTESAAAMTYYAIFSLFPLLALLVIVASLMVPADNISSILGEYLSPVFPVSRDLIDEIIARFVSVRTASGVVGAVTLLWSGSGVFVILARNVNHAWQNARRRNFVQGRLVALSTVGVLLGLLVLGMVASLVFGIITRRLPMLFDGFDPHAPGVRLFARFSPLGLAFLILLVAYRSLPTVPVLLSEAAWGALVVTLAWAVTSSLFSWYIGSGAANFDVIFGPLSALAVLMLWLYFNSMFIVLGAHISAAVGRRNMERNQPAVTLPEDET